LKISIITVTKNSARTIERAVHSVSLQKDVNVEHIIKDAGSNDNTIDIAMVANPLVTVVSINDTGIYDAMNQGYLNSSGDIIAFLNSDDYYIDDYVLSDVINAFNTSDCDFVYGDITMLSLSGEIVRVWHTGLLGKEGLVGQQIPHPSIFIKRNVINQLLTPFDPSYKISADLKQQLLIVNKFKCKGAYLNRSLVMMETGGESTNSFYSYITGWKESVRAYNEVFGRGGIWCVVKKVFSKFKGLKIKAQLQNFGK